MYILRGKNCSATEEKKKRYETHGEKKKVLNETAKVQIDWKCDIPNDDGIVLRLPEETGLHLLVLVARLCLWLDLSRRRHREQQQPI